MSKKKLLNSCVAFSILLPFSCGIVLPSVEALANSKPVAYASTETENQDDTMQISTIQMVFSKVNLNVRSGASTSSSIVGMMTSGESAQLISTSNGWHQISYSGKTAYVSADSRYTAVATLSNTSASVESLVNLNVRASASTSATVLTTLSVGDTLPYIETSGSWHTVLYQGSLAYVSASSSYSKITYQSLDGDSSTGSGTDTDTTESTLSDSFEVKVTATALNVRSTPSTSSTVLDVAPNGSVLGYFETVDGWHKISYNGSVGYVSAGYSVLQAISADEDCEVSDCQTLVMSCVDSLNVRSSPSTSSTVVGSLDKGDMVSFTCLENGWYETVYKGQTAYVSASSVYSSLEYFETGSAECESAISLGCTLLGTPYVYGATRYLNYDGSLNSSFTGNSYDCSSMVQYIYYAALGIELGSTSREQSLDGTYVAIEDLKRGDLMFFTNSDRYYNTGIERIGHVAIYLGNNYILHTASDHAVIEEISETRWKYYITARDVIND